MVHGKGEQHNRRLEQYNLTLRKKCQFGVPQVKWFGSIYSKEGMSPDPKKVKTIQKWPRHATPDMCKNFMSLALTVWES